jgi:hypothetical protein
MAGDVSTLRNQFKHEVSVLQGVLRAGDDAKVSTSADRLNTLRSRLHGLQVTDGQMSELLKGSPLRDIFELFSKNVAVGEQGITMEKIVALQSPRVDRTIERQEIKNANADGANDEGRGGTKGGARGDADALAVLEERVRAAKVEADAALQAVDRANAAVDVALASGQGLPDARRNLRVATIDMSRKDETYLEEATALYEARKAKGEANLLPPALPTDEAGLATKAKGYYEVLASERNVDNRMWFVGQLRSQLDHLSANNPQRKKWSDAAAKYESDAHRLQLSFANMTDPRIGTAYDYLTTKDITAEERAVWTSAMKGKGVDTLGDELIAALGPERETKIRAFRQNLRKNLEAIDNLPLRQAYQKALDAPPKDATERAAIVSAFRAAVLGEVNSTLNYKAMAENAKYFPPEMQSAYRDRVASMERFHQQAMSSCDAMTAMLDSGMPLEALMVLFMAMYHDMKDQAVREKMREVNLAQRWERFQQQNASRLNMLREKDRTYKAFESEVAKDPAALSKYAPENRPKPLDEDEKLLLPECEKWEKFNPSQYGMEMKNPDLLMQELQMLMQQLTQITQAVAAVIRMLQDLALTIIRNIR